MIKTFNSFLVTMFGLGKIKFMPGTFGSLATAIFLFYLFHILNISSNIILIGWIIVFIYSFYAVFTHTRDEAIIYYVLFFILFRYFDIMKPFPVSFFDKNFKNNFGVIMDDICAGLYVVLTLVCFMIVKSYVL